MKPVDQMTRAEQMEAACELSISLSLSTREIDKNRRKCKPLIGGRFGHSGFVIASYHVLIDGLDVVMYYVADRESWFVVGMGRDIADALDGARLFLKEMPPARFARAKADFMAQVRDLENQEKEAAYARQLAARDQVLILPPRTRSIPRRRQRIFEESGGKCHYCETPLVLDGKWHIEHKMPKALGGGNEPTNLVASCVTCNQKKRDTTDIEFKAKRVTA